MGKIMDLINGVKSKRSLNRISEGKSDYILYDTYSTEHRANVYATSLKHAGMNTKVIESGGGGEWQLWYKG